MAGARGSRWFRLAVATDQWWNVAAFDGDPDETISSNCYKRSLKGCRICTAICAALGFFFPDHCRKSAEPDEGDPIPSSRQ